MTPREVMEGGTALVGTTQFTDGTVRAFVWDERNETRDLRQVLIKEHAFSSSNLPELPLTFAISSNGMLIGGWMDFSHDESWIVVLDKPLIAPRGDFNDDHYRNVADIDLLSQAILLNSSDPAFDLNTDGILNVSDRQHWVHDLARTYFGDANLDGQFNNLDLIDVLQAGKYGLDMDAGWAEGDWTGDGRFDRDDIVVALQDGGYGQGALAAVSAVPEPSAVWLMAFAMVVLAQRQLTRGRR
jgi:hypothetical protein